jgi:hypothetical protein
MPIGNLVKIKMIYEMEIERKWISEMASKGSYSMS